MIVSQDGTHLTRGKFQDGPPRLIIDIGAFGTMNEKSSKLATVRNQMFFNNLLLVSIMRTFLRHD